MASLYRGPYDGEKLILPIKAPWERLVVPQFGTVQIQALYFLAGLVDSDYAYLYEDDWGELLTT